jgi:DNA helicase II / ATP-dependent DNA helicase PcrA
LSKIEGFVELISGFKQMLKEVSAYEVALAIARQSHILEDLYKEKTPENLSKFENVQELLNAIQDFTINATEEGSPNGLENYLQEVALLTDQDSDKDEDKNKVTLMTVHSAKGLEFKNVFIVGLEEKLFPSIFSGSLTPENLEEERRLFYVALTRAMKTAWVSYARQRYSWGQLNFCEPSRFISEIDPTYLEVPMNMEMPSFLNKPSKFSKNPWEREAPMTRMQAPPTRQTTENTQTYFSKKLTDMKQAAARPAFHGDDISHLAVGMTVEHQRFGRGKVLEIEGDASSRKATVLFQTAGRKQLLLKFAQLKIVE